MPYIVDRYSVVGGLVYTSQSRAKRNSSMTFHTGAMELMWVFNLKKKSPTSGDLKYLLRKI
jgi:hypothetical protein